MPSPLPTGRAATAFVVPVLAILLAAFLPASSPSGALAEEPVRAGGGTAPGADGQRTLVDREQELARQFRDLEKTFLRLADLLAGSDPRRSALLRSVFAQAREEEVGNRLDTIVQLLEKGQLLKAGTSQAGAIEKMRQLLDLLESGDTDRRLANTKEEVKQFLSRLSKLISRQRDIEGSTEAGGKEARLSERQDALAEETRGLSADIDGFARRMDAREPSGGDPEETKDGKDPADAGEGDAPSEQGKKAGKNGKKDGQQAGKGDGSKPEEGDKQGGDKQGGDKQGGDKQGGDKQGGDKQGGDKQGGDKQGGDKQGGDKQDGDKQDGDKQDGDKQDGAAGSDADKGDGSGGDGEKKPGGEGEQGEPSAGGGEEEQPPGDDEGDDEASRARRTKKRLQAAEKRMRQAREKLDQAKRREARGEQEKAIEELETARAELEEILRQMREEEVERLLVQLGARIRAMLRAERAVLAGTEKIAGIGPAADGPPPAERERQLEAARLGREQAAISNDASRALTLVRDDGSAVAIPEALEQVRDDSVQAAARLARGDVGATTRGILQDLVASLEEMLAALEKAQREQQARQQSPSGGRPAEPGQQPLVDKLSELKMIRSLQMRVNTRTKRFAQLLEDGAEQAEEPELLDALSRLSARQRKIERAAHDIVSGRTE
jgi:hypothetical protein